ncbi:MAG: glycosyltransferase family 4 protein [Planctomycetota bacterium]
MKVAITHTRYCDKGGVERYVYDLVGRLLAAGHEVHYFCHFWDDHVDPRVKLHRIPNTWKQIRFMKVWSYDRWLSQRVKREDFDVVHGFSKSSYQDIYTDGSGCLLDFQGYSIDEAAKSGLKRALKRRSWHQKQVLEIEKRRFTRGNFHRIVVMSDLVGEQIKSRYGLTSDEVITLYNGIDTERFHPRNRERYDREYRERIVIPKRTFVALCIGNDYKRKGVPALIEAARIVQQRGGLPDDRQLRVAIVGQCDPRYEKELSQLARAKGVWDVVKFYGVQHQVDRWHSIANLFVLPTRFDAFGNVVLEAMATGVPTLVSKKAGAAECVREGETGWVLQDPDDAHAIAERIFQLAGDPELERRMGEAARDAACTYSWDVHFERMLALYEEVRALKAKKRASA